MDRFRAVQSIFICIYSHTLFVLGNIFKVMVSKVNAAHILVKDKKTAEDLLQKMKVGAKFSDLAKKNSICPSGKAGGDLGWFGPGQMVPEFEKAAFDGAKGAIVGPVRTNFGYHLIFIKDKKD